MAVCVSSGRCSVIRLYPCRGCTRVERSNTRAPELSTADVDGRALSRPVLSGQMMRLCSDQCVHIGICSVLALSVQSANRERPTGRESESSVLYQSRLASYFGHGLRHVSCVVCDCVCVYGFLCVCLYVHVCIFIVVLCFCVYVGVYMHLFVYTCVFVV